MVSETPRLHLALPARPTTADTDRTERSTGRHAGGAVGPERRSEGRSEDNDRLSSMFHHHYDFVWRSVRRLGVPEDAVDDAAQEVFVVASRKLDAIDAGKEKAFLFGTAARIAADTRRALQRRRQSPCSEEPEPIDATPALDELVEQKRARETLDHLIAQLPEEARPVFVLFELEGMTMAEIASCLELPAGTVASRLRRARELFATQVARLEARSTSHG